MAAAHPLLISAFLACALTAAGAPAQDFSPPVLLPGDDAVAASAGWQDLADVEPGAGGFLVVWEDTRAELAGVVDPGGYVRTTDIYAARLDAQGRPVDPSPIVVSQAVYNQARPRVAWNGQNWLVVWRSRRTTQYASTDNVLATRISPGGEVLDDPPIVVDDDDSIDESPWDVASDGSSWAVLWQDVAAGSYVMSGAVVDAGGSVVLKRPTVAPGNLWNARLVWGGDRYLVAWQQWSGASSSWDITALFVDASLNPIGTVFPVTTSWENQIKASVAWNGTDFYVAWEKDDTYWGAVEGTPVSPSGTVVRPGGVDLTPGIYPLDPFPSAAWDGSRWQVAWEDWAFGPGFSLHLSRADAGGSLAAPPETVVAPGAWVGQPAMASAAAGALLIWTDARLSGVSYVTTQDLFATLVPGSGPPGAQFPVSVSPPAQVQPELAGDETAGYLVAFASMTSGETRILAQRVDFFGRPVDPQPIELARGSPDLRSPAVGWNGAMWLVAWEDYAGSAGTSRIRAARILPDGTVLDPVPLDLLNANQPAVAGLGGAFLVAASHEPMDHVRWIHAVRVRAGDGAVLDPAPLFLGGSFATGPAVAAFSDRWLVAWQRNFTHDDPNSNIHANFVLADGTVLGESIPGSGGFTSRQRSPALAVAGDTALITWEDRFEIAGLRIREDGTYPGGPAPTWLSQAAHTQFGPGAAWNGLRWLVAFNDYRIHAGHEPGLGDIQATRVRPDGTAMDPGGLPAATDPARPEGDPALAAARGTSVLASTEVRPERPHGTWRIALRFLGPRLSATTLQRGQPATLTVEGAEPLEPVHFLYSLKGTGGGPCSGKLGGLCLDLLGPVQLAGQARADAAGTATLTLKVPGNAPLGDVHLQAVMARGPLSGKSQPLTAPVLP